MVVPSVPCPVFVLRVSFGFEIQIGGREISTTAARAVGLATAHRGRRGVYAGWLYGGGGTGLSRDQNCIGYSA